MTISRGKLFSNELLHHAENLAFCTGVLTQLFEKKMFDNQKKVVIKNISYDTQSFLFKM